MNPSLTAKELRITLVCAVIYVTIYALEAPFRYMLALTKLNQLILLRDLLILGPLVFVAAAQINRRKLDPVFLVFGFLLSFQAMVFYVNSHATTPIIIGAKMFLNILTGLLLASALINGKPWMVRWLAILFGLSCAGLLMEKFLFEFPWVGMIVNIGGLDVPISLDWQSGGDLEKRVGGFTRVSINAASLVPFLGFAIVNKVRSYPLRLLVVLLVMLCVALTTQKGALLACVAVSCALLLPRPMRLTGLRCVLLAGLAAQIVLPFMTNGMLMSEGSGSVFSTSSFAARVLYTWPASTRYVYDNSLLIFGVGLGGLGGPMRLVATDALWMYPDNMFIFVIGYMGVFALVYYGAILYAVWRSLRLRLSEAEGALAILAFIMWYGVVVTGIEDQVTALGLGASLGVLLYAIRVPVAETRPAGRSGELSEFEAGRSA